MNHISASSLNSKLDHPTHYSLTQMDPREVEDVLHEVCCRDLYLLNRARQTLMVRPAYEDLPEQAIVNELYGPHAPEDLHSFVVIKISEEHQKVCRDLINDKRSFEDGICVYDPLTELTTLFEGVSTKEARASGPFL